MQGSLFVGWLEGPFANSLRRAVVVSMKAYRRGRGVDRVRD